MFKETNPYFNTIWSERDQEFFWSGMKDGFKIGSFAATVLVSNLWAIGIGIYSKVKQDKS